MSDRMEHQNQENQPELERMILNSMRSVLTSKESFGIQSEVFRHRKTPFEHDRLLSMPHSIDVASESGFCALTPPFEAGFLCGGCLSGLRRISVTSQ